MKKIYIIAILLLSNIKPSLGMIIPENQAPIVDKNNQCIEDLAQCVEDIEQYLAPKKPTLLINHLKGATTVISGLAYSILVNKFYDPIANSFTNIGFNKPSYIIGLTGLLAATSATNLTSKILHKLYKKIYDKEEQQLSDVVLQFKAIYLMIKPVYRDNSLLHDQQLYNDQEKGKICTILSGNTAAKLLLKYGRVGSALGMRVSIYEALEKAKMEYLSMFKIIETQAKILHSILEKTTKPALKKVAHTSLTVTEQLMSRIEYILASIYHTALSSK